MALRIQAKIFAGGNELKFYSLDTSGFIAWGGSGFSWVSYCMTRKQKRREEKEERTPLLLCARVIVGLI